MTEAHPIRKLLNDTENERDAMNVSPEMMVDWRNSFVGKAFFLEIKAELLELYLSHTQSDSLDMFSKGAIGVLETLNEWGIPEEVEEDGIHEDQQG